MPKASLYAQMFKTPRKFVSDGRFTPEGTVQFRHTVSIEGEAQDFYCDTDLTAGLNGSRSKLDTGDPVPVEVDLDLGMATVGNKKKLVAQDLVAVRERKG